MAVMTKIAKSPTHHWAQTAQPTRMRGHQRRENRRTVSSGASGIATPSTLFRSRKTATCTSVQKTPAHPCDNSARRRGVHRASSRPAPGAPPTTANATWPTKPPPPRSSNQRSIEAISKPMVTKQQTPWTPLKRIRRRTSAPWSSTNSSARTDTADLHAVDRQA